WATIRIAPGRPVRPSGDVMCTARFGLSGPTPAWSVDELSAGPEVRISSDTATARPATRVRIARLRSRSRVGRRGLCFVHEVAGARPLEKLRRQSPRLSEVLGERKRLIDQVARLAAAQRDAAGAT